MKDRSVRRHQTFKTQKKNIKTYNSCIQNIPEFKRKGIENNLNKLRKACAINHLTDDSRPVGKSLRELKHDITMKEQLSQI